MAETMHDHRTDERVVTTPPPPPPTYDDRDDVRVVERHTTAERTTSLGRGTARMVVAALGISGMILGSFMDWTGGRIGVEHPIESYVRTGTTGDASFFASAGIVTIGLGIIGLIGIAMLGGWLLRLAGVAGIATFVLMLVTMGRVDGASIPEDVQIGLWLVLAGSIFTLIAGFIRATTVVQVPESEIVTTERR